MANIPYPEQYDDSFMNIFKRIIDELNSMGYTYEEALQKAHDILDEAQQTNDMNTAVNERLDNIIADSGTSSTEVVDARIDAEGNEYTVLKDRLDEKEQNFSTQLAQTDYINQMKNLNSYENIRFFKTHDGGMQQFDIFLENEDNEQRMTFVKPDDYFKLSELEISRKETITNNTNVNIDDVNLVGNWYVSGNLVRHARDIGDYAEYAFVLDGTGSVKINHYAESRGGIFEATLNGQTVTYSTYAESPTTINRTLFEGIPAGNHTLRLEFKGDDPENPPSSGAGTSRGLTDQPELNGQPSTFLRISETVTEVLPPIRILAKTSNKEFAFKLAPINTDSTEWVPSHGTYTATNKSEPVFVIDGVEYNFSNFNINQSVNCKDFKLIQDIYGGHTGSGKSQLVNIKSVHSITPDGNIHMSGSMKVLEDIKIDSAYVIMSPVNNALFDLLQTGIGTKYECKATDNTFTDLAEGINISNYIYLSTTDDYFLAFKHSTPRNNFDISGSAEKSYRNFLNHRDAGIVKHYINVFGNDVILPVGYKYNWSGDFIGGHSRGVYDLISE